MDEHFKHYEPSSITNPQALRTLKHYEISEPEEDCEGRNRLYAIYVSNVGACWP